MAINWKAFYANGGYSNENSDPLSYDDGEEENEDENEDENENENENLFTGICNPCEQEHVLHDSIVKLVFTGICNRRSSESRTKLV